MAPNPSLIAFLLQFRHNCQILRQSDQQKRRFANRCGALRACRDIYYLQLSSFAFQSNNLAAAPGVSRVGLDLGIRDPPRLCITS